MEIKQNSIAIIPARSGSKRIPNKNIKDFLGQPIISRVIKTTIESQLFDKVIVSTDSTMIAEIAVQYGATVPFFRSEKTSDDFASTSDVLFEVISDLKKLNMNYVTACCIYPTAVLIQPDNLKHASQLYHSGKFDSLISALKFSYPIQRALKQHSNRLEMAWPEYKLTRSQDLEVHYHDAGQFYFFNIAAFVEKKQLFTQNTGFYLLKEHEAQDIDNLEDWTMAELKYRYLHSIH